MGGQAEDIRSICCVKGAFQSVGIVLLTTKRTDPCSTAKRLTEAGEDGTIKNSVMSLELTSTAAVICGRGDENN